MQDRDRLKRKERIKRAEGEEQTRLFFRNLFIDERDADIAKIVWNLFDAVNSRWPDHWNNTLLSKSTGVIAFMKFLKPAYLHLADKIGDVVPKNKFSELLANVSIEGNTFTKENYLPGTTGQSKLYKELVHYTGLIN